MEKCIRRGQPWQQLLALVAAGLGSIVPINATETVWLDTLDLTTMHQGWGSPQINHSVTGKPLIIGGQKFERGVGTHAMERYTLELGGGAREFIATIGLDDDANGPGSVVFQLLADGEKLFDSGVMKSNTPAKSVRVDLTGRKRLVLKVIEAGDGITFDHADWADARFVVDGVKPKPLVVARETPYLLTPKPGPAPRINGPVIYGVRPGHPFLYRIPAQGERPMEFSAKDLPAGLELNARSGIISGTIPARGEYRVSLSAQNRHGTDHRNFKIVCGDTLALTPPMGWNHWYAHYDRITDAMMREAADLMIRSGMADVGFQYVNIDDCWMNAEKNRDPARSGLFRDAAGNLLPNTYFPDMKALADYIHRRGLKAGLYTSPGAKTCGGFAGTYQHEAQDARQFADWGFDFLKYDWCSYNVIASNPPTLEEMKRPYILMGNLLKQQNRDFVFNLCQYGMGDVWKWGTEVGGHSWRTSDDLGNELNRIFEVALKNARHRDWQKPGAWNDPDYIQIGYVGSVRPDDAPKKFPLTPNEQYAFMSLWCLMASPLFYSGDMTRLDEFTLNVLCNPEVIEVDQDPLGECARGVELDEDRFMMIKNMEDGSKVLGLGNKGDVAMPISVAWESLGISGNQRLRDLWRQKELGIHGKKFETTVPGRFVVLIRLWPVR